MPLDTILLLDTSGSMSGRGLHELKRAAHAFLEGVEETARQTGLKVRYTTQCPRVCNVCEISCYKKLRLNFVADDE